MQLLPLILPFLQLFSSESHAVHKFCCRAEPNMLKILPIIPSRTSQNFDPLIILILFPHHLLFLYCIGDNNIHNTH